MVHTSKTAYSTSPFDDSDLEPEADTQERPLLFARPFGGQDHAFCTSMAKSTRDEDTTTSKTSIGNL